MDLDTSGERKKKQEGGFLCQNVYPHFSRQWPEQGTPVTLRRRWLLQRVAAQQMPQTGQCYTEEDLRGNGERVLWVTIRHP